MRTLRPQKSAADRIQNQGLSPSAAPLLPGVLEVTDGVVCVEDHTAQGSFITGTVLRAC